jgi:hypothetical protein
MPDAIRDRQITVGDIRALIADLADDAPVEVIIAAGKVGVPSGASVALTVFGKDGLQFLLREDDIHGEESVGAN